MMYQMYAPNRETQLLSGIHEGMIVYDWDDKKVGSVNYVQLPSEGEGDALYNAALRADAVDHRHNDLRIHLLRAGFIQVESGLFSPMCYITPLQIHEVIDKTVKLNVVRAALVGF